MRLFGYQVLDPDRRKLTREPATIAVPPIFHVLMYLPRNRDGAGFVANVGVQDGTSREAPKLA